MDEIMNYLPIFKKIVFLMKCKIILKKLMKMYKRILITCLILFLFSVNFLSAQENNCPKIIVGVEVAEVYDQVFDQLNKDYPPRSKSEWLGYIESELMKILREDSPELNFISLSANPAADHDYLFSSLITLTGGGEDVLVYPEETIIDGDNVFIIPPVFSSEYTVYKVWSMLVVNSHCYPNRRYILVCDSGESQDIYRALLSSLFGFGRGITYILYERESTRPVPPREPIIDTWLEGEYLSPLKVETRKIKIIEKVLSCNWQPAYYLFQHSQPVRFPHYTDRGKIEPAENCKIEFSLSKEQYILVNKQGCAVGEYTLERGLDPAAEKYTLSTCPLGNKPNIDKEVEIIIRGLEMTVTPEKKRIRNGEEVKIEIDLHEIDPDGNKYPAADQKIEFEVSGLIDGTIDSEEKVTTDKDGLATIVYKSGQKDEKIKITATFTPPDYPDKVEEEAEISLTDMISISVRETESGSVKGGDPPYPYNYTVSMDFKGKAINSKNIYRIIPNLPESLRSLVMKEGSLAMKEECTLIAELEPDEKSMKVVKWECSDPINNGPKLALLELVPPYHKVPIILVRIWQIGDKIYITHLEGILNFFAGYEDPRYPNQKEPLGARIETPFGSIGEYIEVPYGKFINGETIILHPKDVSDHNIDVWQWKTSWTVTINPN